MKRFSVCLLIVASLIGMVAATSKTPFQATEDCAACRFIWKQVEMQISNARYIRDVQTSFLHFCSVAQQTPIFSGGCSEMYYKLSEMSGDYMSEKYTVDQMCERAKLCIVGKPPGANADGLTDAQEEKLKGEEGGDKKLEDIKEQAAEEKCAEGDPCATKELEKKKAEAASPAATQAPAPTPAAEGPAKMPPVEIKKQPDTTKKIEDETKKINKEVKKDETAVEKKPAPPATTTGVRTRAPPASVPAPPAVVAPPPPPVVAAPPAPPAGPKLSFCLNAVDKKAADNLLKVAASMGAMTPEVTAIAGKLTTCTAQQKPCLPAKFKSKLVEYKAMLGALAHVLTFPACPAGIP